MVEKLERIGDQGHIYLILTLTSTSNLPLLLFLEFIEILNFISQSFPPPPPLFSIFLQGEEIPFKLDLIGFSFSFVHVNFISFGSSFCHPMYQDYAPFCTFLMKKKIHYYINFFLKCFPCIPPSHALGFFLFFFFFFSFQYNLLLNRIIYLIWMHGNQEATQKQ